MSVEARRNATFLFHAHLRATLATKRVLSEYRLTQEAFSWLVGEIETRFQTVRVLNFHLMLRYCTALSTWGHAVIHSIHSTAGSNAFDREPGVRPSSTSHLKSTCQCTCKA